MKCPLLSIPMGTSLGKAGFAMGECGEEECAWWDGHGGFCAVLKIARHLEAITQDPEEKEV